MLSDVGIISPSEIFREVRQRHVVEAEDREILQQRYPLGQPENGQSVTKWRERGGIRGNWIWTEKGR